jgi:hypothetical protein
MGEHQSITQGAAPANSIIVVAICSIPQLRATLESIASQDGFDRCEVIVALDPRLGSPDELRADFPAVQFLVRDGVGTPVELTTMALGVARGERVILTEDSCIASPGWLRNLLDAPTEGRAAVGGAVEATEGISNAMWAFCYVDFFRYMPPLAEGETPTLSVCNISYQRKDLDSIASRWANGFNENDINTALQAAVGPLWLRPDAQVRVKRNVTYRDAVYERYAFGRLFGATRIANATMGRRLYYAATAPALPALLLSRMTAKARQDPALQRRFIGALPEILAMVAAWSWGEWLGYVTARRPKRITTAPDIGSVRGSPAAEIA